MSLALALAVGIALPVLGTVWLVTRCILRLDKRAKDANLRLAQQEANSKTEQLMIMQQLYKEQADLARLGIAPPRGIEQVMAQAKQAMKDRV